MGQTEPRHEPTPRTSYQGFPLRAWLALIALIGIIGFSGYVLYQRVAGRTLDARGLEEIGGARRAMDIGQPRVIPDGVRTSGNMHQVKAGDSRLTITKRADGTWNYNFSYEKPDLLTAEQQAAFTARFRLSRDAAFAKALHVSDEQIRQLRELPPRPGMIVSDADRKRVERAFEQYLNAPPPRDRQTAELVEALRQTGENSLPATRRTLAEQVRQIQSILTVEQIDRFKRPGN